LSARLKAYAVDLPGSVLGCSESIADYGVRRTKWNRGVDAQVLITRLRLVWSRHEQMGVRDSRDTNNGALNKGVNKWI